MFALSALLFSSCGKRNTNDDNYLANDDDRIGYASDASRIEFANNDVISLADQAGILYNAEYIRKSTSTCATVAVDTINTPHTLIVRFGDVDCECADGRKRRGSIIVRYNGRYLDTNQVHTITYNNYYLDGNQMTGWVKTTRVDTTVTGNWYYKIQVNDSLNMSPDPLKSQYIVWSGNLLRRWVGGATTNDRGDDFYSISGMATLTRPNGHVFNFNIATPLQFTTSCNFAQSGVVNVTGYTGNRVLNYGSGSCDDAAQLNIGVHVYQLTLTY
ncbi:hypothetical protein GCM10023093_26540 [Nemorincola caseinilytica]|uniref:Lipoprotein n=1 Tax=Nemorincola caseinilytica TaxID=2054315 RepID=A0ABP8NN56_9BACT